MTSASPSMPTTAVTMYFNIKHLPDATEDVRPRSFYMEKGISTLSLNAPMVIFCDDSCYEDIQALRNKCVPNAAEITTYIRKPITEYDLYRDNFPIIRKNREGNHKYVNNRNTASYFILSMFKVLGVYLAKQLNPYGTPYYAWIDFGGSHVMRGFDSYAMQMLEAPKPKVALCYIHFRGADELTMTSEYSRGGYCGIAAGAFTAEASVIDQFYNGTMSVFHELLAHQTGHAEEQVFTYFYQRYPHLVTLYYGDYYSIITNYHAVREDFGSVWHHFILEACHKGRKDLAKECASSILTSVDHGIVCLSAEEVERLRGV